jgi:N-acetyl-alpha-D-glucosaminyl L-malate synthase BshA
MRKMKIGIVLYPTFGGSGVVATELGLELAKMGHCIHFISYSQPARLDSFYENVYYHEVVVPEYPLFEYAPYETALTSKIVDVSLYENLDLIHVHYAIPHATSAYLAKMILKSKGKHVPFITTLHGTDITLVGKDSSYSPAITFAINNSDAVTTVSESLRIDTLKNFVITKKINVIHNFINNSLYEYKESDCIRKSTVPNGEKLITHISNFRPVKRIPDIIHAFHLIVKKIPSKLLMVGDGPERSNAEKLVRELGIEKDVIFIGKIKQSYNVLPCSDLYMLLSDSESFGLSALEAMASGVPVLSTNTGGLPEVQIQGETGFLCNVGDIEEIANKAIYILEDEERLKVFKENAKRHSQEFSIQKIVPQYEALYLSVIQ